MNLLKFFLFSLLSINVALAESGNLMPRPQPQHRQINSAANVLVIDDQVTGEKYVTTLTSRGGVAGFSTAIFGGNNIGSATRKVATWYTHKPHGELKKITFMQPSNAYRGLADIRGSTIPLSGSDKQTIGHHIYPQLSEAALQSLFQAPNGSTQKLSLRELYQNGSQYDLTTIVNKKAQLILGIPKGKICSRQRIEGVDGLQCVLRSVQSQSVTRDGGDIQFMVRGRGRFPYARFRGAGHWYRFGESMPLKDLANAHEITVFFVPPKGFGEMSFTGSQFEAGFYSRSRLGLGDRFNLRLRNAKFTDNNVKTKMTRMSMLVVDDAVSNQHYLTTLQGANQQAVYGVTPSSGGGSPVIWSILDKFATEMNIQKLTPQKLFLPLEKFAKNSKELKFSQEGVDFLSQLPIGGQQLLHFKNVFGNNQSNDYYTSLFSGAKLSLHTPQGKICQQSKIDNVIGTLCVLRKYSFVSRVGIGTDVQFRISGRLAPVGSKYRVGEKWHKFGDSIALSEFKGGNKIEVFITKNTSKIVQERSRGLDLNYLFEAQFYSIHRQMSGDFFRLSVKEILKDTIKKHNAENHLNLLLVTDSQTQKSYVTTLSSNNAQQLYGNQQNVRWYPFGRVMSVQENQQDKMKASHAILLLQQLTPQSYFNFKVGKDAKILRNGMSINDLGWQALQRSHIGERTTLGYTLGLNDARYQVNTSVSKQAALRFDSPKGKYCHQDKIKGIAGSVCVLREYQVDGSFMEGSLASRLSGMPAGAFYRFSSGKWSNSRQFMPLVISKNKSNGYLEIFVPANNSKFGHITNSLKFKPVLELFSVQQNLTQKIPLPIVSLSDSAAVNQTMHSTGVYSNLSAGNPGVPSVLTYTVDPFSKITSMRPRIDGMLSSTTHKMYNETADIIFMPSGTQVSYNVNHASTIITVPAHTTKIKVTMLPIDAPDASYADANFSNPEAGFIFYGSAGELDIKVVLGVSGYNSLGSNIRMDMLVPETPYSMPGGDVRLAVSLVAADTDKNAEIYCQSASHSDFNDSMRLVDKVSDTVLETALLTTSRTKFSTKIKVADVNKYRISLHIKEGLDAKNGVISCVAAPEGVDPSSIKAILVRASIYYGTGVIQLFSTDAPSSSIAGLSYNAQALIDGSTDHPVNLMYQIAPLGSGDIIDLSKSEIYEIYSEKKFPLSSLSGTLVIPKFSVSSYNFRIATKAASVGKQVLVTNSISEHPSDSLSALTSLTDGILFYSSVTPSDFAVRGGKATYDYRLDHAVVAGETDTLNLQLLHSTNSDVGAVLGKDVDKTMTVTYLPGGTTKSFDATKTVTLSPPIGTSQIKAEINIIGDASRGETTVGMKAESFSDKGAWPHDNTSSLSSKTNILASLSLDSVTAPASNPAGLTFNESINTSGADTADGQLFYKFSTIGTGDVKKILDYGKTVFVDLNSGLVTPITSAEGSIKIPAGQVPKLIAKIGTLIDGKNNQLISTFWLSKDPAGAVAATTNLTDEVAAYQSVLAPEKVLRGNMVSYNYTLTRAVDNSKKDHFNLTVLHSGNSDNGAVLGEDLDKNIVITYLPSGEKSENGIADSLVLVPPAGTTSIKAEVNVIGDASRSDTTFGMLAESFSDRGEFSNEKTASLKNTTSITSFSISDVTDVITKEGVDAIQRITYTKVMSSGNRLYLRYVPAVTLHAASSDDYDASKVEVHFSDGRVTDINLTSLTGDSIELPSGSTYLDVSIPLMKDDINEWSDEQFTLQAATNGDFLTGTQHGNITILNELAPTNFDISVMNTSSSIVTAKFGEAVPVNIDYDIVRTEGNHPMPDQIFSEKIRNYRPDSIADYLSHRIADSAHGVEAVLTGPSKRGQCAFTINSHSDQQAPVPAFLQYFDGSGTKQQIAQGCDAINPLDLRGAAWTLISYDEEAGIYQDKTSLSVGFTLNDPHTDMDFNGHGWEGSAHANGTLDIHLFL